MIVYFQSSAHAVPNEIVSTITSETSTTTRHRDANTSAAHWGHRARAICRRRVRGHDSCSGDDDVTIQRDCEQHHGGLRNWSCEHERPTVLPARDWVCQIHTHKTGMSTTLSMNWNWSTPDTEEKYSARCVITTKTTAYESFWSERGKNPVIHLQRDIPVEARGEQAPAMLDSPRQPARRVVPPVPIVLAVVLHINHAHPLVMTAMNRGRGFDR